MATLHTIALALPLLALAPETEAPGPVTRATAEVDREREANEEAYREVYLGLKEALFEKHAGEWLVIVDGKLLPLDGWSRPAPTPDLATALAAADAVAPKALHRFVFRVGEEGDVNYHPTLSSRDDLVGGQFLDFFDDVCWITPLGVWVSPRGKEWNEGVQIGPGDSEDGGPSFRADVSQVGDEGGDDVELQIATGYSGYAILGAKTAHRLGLHRWEIPGAVHQQFDTLPTLRRARARFRVESVNLDARIPVAIRTE